MAAASSSSAASVKLDAAHSSSADAAASIRAALPPLSPLSLCWALSLDDFAASRYAEPASFARLLVACEADDEGERKRIMRFHFPADRQRALLARMALRALLGRVLGARSAYGKPFVVEPADAAQRVVFNLSHHGKFVVLAAEIAAESTGSAASASSSRRPLPLLGCDVTTVVLPHGAASVEEFFECFRTCFTGSEWKIIRGEGQDAADSSVAASPSASAASSASSAASTPSSSSSLIRFAWLWSLKESLIKAIGMGLSFELTHIEFAFSDPNRRAAFSPVSVRFLGEPKFAAEASLAAPFSSAPATAASLSPPLVRPSELPASLDLTRDVCWSFASALTDDGQHVVSVCKGWRNEADDPQPTAEPDSASASPSLPDTSSALQSVESVTDLSQLRTLGRCISQTTAEARCAAQPHQLRIQLISHEQIIPMRAVQ